MKKLLAIILAILMIVTTMPMAFAADCTHPSFKSGKCISCSYECDHSNWGYDSCKTCKMKGTRPTDQSATIKWYYDESTNYLKITGVGDMPDYSDAYSLPWYNYYSRIQTVVIAEGITSVGTGAFNMCSYVTSVTLPNTLTKIGSRAFSSCSNLKDVVIPSSVTTMYMDSFNYMSSVLKVHYCGASADLTVSGGSPSYLHYCEKRAGTEATCTEPGVADTWYCANCRKTVAGGEAIPAAHKTVAVEAKTPTCTEIGWDAYEYCTACDYTTYVEKEALKHSFTKYEVTEEAKCGVAGKKVAVCDNGCGATDEKAIEALKHSLVLIKTTPAKCGEPMVEFYDCEFCYNCEVARPKFGTALFHSFTKYEITEAPTCNKAGEKAAPCDNGCGEIDVQTVPALDDHVDADGDYKCDFGCGHEFEKPAPEDDVCEDCGRPVHDDTLVQNFVCWIIMLVNLIKSMF